MATWSLDLLNLVTPRCVAVPPAECEALHHGCAVQTSLQRSAAREGLPPLKP